MSAPKPKPKRGWLTKQGEQSDLSRCAVAALLTAFTLSSFLVLAAGAIVKNWKRRYFVLEGYTLKYYKDESEGVEAGSINVADCVSVKGAEDATKKPNSLLLQAGERTFYFVADTHQEKTDWINVLGKAIIMQGQLDNTYDYEDFAERPDEPEPEPCSPWVVRGQKRSPPAGTPPRSGSRTRP